MHARTAAGSLVAASLILAAFSARNLAHAQTYTTQVLLDQNTPRPDGQGNFNIDWVIPPAFDGTTTTFVNFGPTALEYWAENPTTKTFTKLLDTSSRAPGGSGTFSTFMPPNNNLSALAPKIAAGRLYFWAEDQNGSNGSGLYWVSLAGGTVHLVVNELTAKPEGGTFDFISSFAVSGTTVLFNTPTGVFVGESGVAPIVVADGNTKIMVAGSSGLYGCYAGKAIDGANVAVAASDCFDPSRGFNVLFVGPYASFATPTKLPVVTSNETLPGDSNATPHLDVISNNAFLSGNTLYFGTTDNFSTASGGFYGQYFAQFGPNGAPVAPSGSPINKVFDNVTSGLTSAFGQFFGTNFAQGTFAFVATDAATGTSGIYLASGATPSLASTDLQRGVATPVALGNGRIAFGGAGFFDPQLDFVSQSACRVAVAPGVTVARGQPVAGGDPGDYQQGVRLTNTGAAPVAGPIDLELNKLTAGVSLVNRTGYSQCSSPAGNPYITVVARGANLAPGAAVTSMLEFWSPASATFGYQPVVLKGVGTP